MLTEKDYCDYETCVALREFGYNYPQRLIPDYFGVFDEPQYDEKIHLYDAQKWLREENGIIVYPQYLPNCQTWMCMVYEEKKMLMHSIGRGSYNEVLNEGIMETVKILKER